MSFPNLYENSDYYARVELGGRLIKAHLVEVSGNKVKDKWTFQRSRETGNMVAVFGGSEPSEGIEMTFEAPDAETFADLRDLWELLKPKPTSTGTGTVKASEGQQYAIGSPSKDGADSGSSTTGSTSASSYVVPDKAGAPKGGGQNVGPRPPTLPIRNGFVNWLDVWAVARGAWEGPTPSEGNSARVKVTFVPDKPPVPAGAGAMKPAATDGSQYALGSTDPQAAADAAKKRAEAGAAGT